MPIEDQYHKIFWDHEKTKYHMRTTGFFSKYLDQKFGFGMQDLEDLDKQSVRRQEEIITQRAKLLNKMTLLKNKYDHRASKQKMQSHTSQMSYDYEIDKRRIKAKSNATLQTFSSPGKTGESTMAGTAVLFSPLLVKHRDSLYSSAAGPKEQFDHMSGCSPHQQLVSTQFDSSQTPMSRHKKHSIDRMRENIIKIGSQQS